MADIHFKQLQAEMEALAKDIARGAEAIRREAQFIDEEAKDTARVADNIGAMRVDRATVSETQGLSRVMAGLSESVLAYAVAGDATAKQAQAVHAQNQASHGGINEAVGRSPVGQEIYDVDREWFRQE